MKKISIIVPVYNVEKYLQDCIDSLVEQTLEDIEIIFVNDASPDGSLKILLENEAKYPNKIRVIDCKENRMQGGARNIGIREAKGEYIGFVDSDDFVHPAMYEKLYRQVEGCDAVFAKSAQVQDDCDARAIRTGPLKDEFLNWNGGDFAYLNRKELTPTDIQDMQVGNMGGIWCGLYRRSLIVENDIWFPEHIKFEDFFWAILVRCYFQKIAFAPGAVYYYRVREGSTVRSRNAPHQYDRITVERLLQEEVRKRGLWEKYKDALIYLYIYRYAFNTYFKFHQYFDEPDVKTLCGVIKDMRKQYPYWFTNKYFKKENGIKYRFLCAAISIAPRTMSKALRALKVL